MPVKTLPPVSALSRTPIEVRRDGRGNLVLTFVENPSVMDFLATLCATLARVEPMVQNQAFFIALGQVPVYANNAAALAGGLMAGNLYRSAANPSVVAIVT